MGKKVKSGLQWAVTKAGGVQAFAELLGVHPATVRSYLHKEGVTLQPERPFQANAVSRAVDAAGGAPVVAAELGVSPQAVRNFMKAGFMPAERAQQMELAYGVDRISLLSPKLRNSIGAGGVL